MKALAARIGAVTPYVMAALIALPAAADDRADRALVRAAVQGDLPRVGEALRRGASAGAVIEMGEDGDAVSALLAAVWARSPEVVARLLRAGADPRQLEAEAFGAAVRLADVRSLRHLLTAMGPRRQEDPLLDDPLSEVLAPQAICFVRTTFAKGILEATANDDDAGNEAPLTLETCLREPQDDLAEMASLLRAHGYVDASAGPSADEARAERLVRAAEAGNDEQVIALLADKTNPAIPTKDGRYALPEAAVLGRMKSVSALLAAGAPVDAHGLEQVRALTAAAAGNRLDLGKALLDAGATVAKRGDNDWPLRSAVRAGSVAFTEMLLARGAKLSETDSRGRSVLHEYNRSDHALESGWIGYRPLSAPHYAIPAFLVAKGFDFRQTDTSGQRDDVLSSVIGEVNDLALIEALVSAGAPVSDQAMRQAAIYKKGDVLGLLIRNGGDPNNSEVLDYLARHARSHPSLFQALLGAGARGPSDVSEAQYLRRTLVVEGAAEALGTVIARNPPPPGCPPKGVNPPAQCEYAHELLLEAVRRGHADVVRVLSERGINAASVDSDGYTVLHQLLDEDVRARKKAADKGAPAPSPSDARVTAAMAAVLENAPDLMTVVTRWGHTPRMIATRHAVTNTWLDKVIATAASKESELHRAIRRNKQGRVAELIKSGVAVDALDGLQRTPLTLALQLRRHAIAAFLLQKDAHYTVVPRNGYQSADIEYAGDPDLASAFLVRLLRDQLLDVHGIGDEHQADVVLNRFAAQQRGLRNDIRWTVSCDVCSRSLELAEPGRLKGLPIEADRQPRLKEDAPPPGRDLFWIRQDTLGPVPFSVDLGRPLGHTRPGLEITFTAVGARRIPGCDIDFATNAPCFPEVVIENPNTAWDIRFHSSSGPVAPPVATITVTQNGRLTPVGPGDRQVFDRSKGALDIQVGPVTSRVLGLQSVAVTAGVGPKLDYDLGSFSLERRTAVYAAIAQLLHEKGQLPTKPTPGTEARNKTLAAAVRLLTARLVKARVPAFLEETLRSRAREIAHLDSRLVELHRVLYANVVTPAELTQTLQRIDLLLPQLDPSQRARLQDVRRQVEATRDAAGNTTAAITILKGSFYTDVHRLAAEYQALILEYAQYVPDAKLEALLSPSERASISARLLASDVVITDDAHDGRGARLRSFFGLPGGMK